MSLPLKKRPYRGPQNTIPAKVARLERKVARISPDLCSFEVYGTTSGGTAGYNEWWLPLLSAPLTASYINDFVIEAVKFRVHGNTAGNVNEDCRVDIVAHDGIGAATQPASTQVTQHLDIKKWKTFASKTLSWATSSPNRCVDATTRIGRVAKWDGTTLNKNQIYLVIRWKQGVTAPTFDYGVQILCREK